MNGQGPHSQQRGYVPGLPEYFTQNNYGQVAPPGYAFNRQGELVQLPYEPWSQGPQIAWESPDNPDYLEYIQGRSTIENQPSADPRLGLRYGKHVDVGHRAPVTHQDVAIVPLSERLRRRDGDDIPQQEEGTGSQAVFDAPASPVRIRWELGREILGVVQVDPPLSGSPLLVQPVGDAEGAGLAPYFGGAVALGVCTFGHLGTARQMVFDVLPGTMVKIPTVDSFLRIAGRISPRYFAHADAGVSPNIIRTYLLYPGGPALTSASFTDLPPNIMELQGSGPGTIVAAGAAQNPVIFSGWPAEGLSPTPDQETLPVRIFRGSVLSSGAGAFTNRARIPIPFGAVSVAVFGGFYNPADTPAVVTVGWTQNLDVTNAVLGFFPSDPESPVPIVQGVTSIDVFGGNSAAAGDIEIPFFAYFYINV